MPSNLTPAQGALKLRARMALYLIENAGRRPLHKDTLRDGPFTAPEIAAHADTAIKIAMNTLMMNAAQRAHSAHNDAHKRPAVRA